MELQVGIFHSRAGGTQLFCENYYVHIGLLCYYAIVKLLTVLIKQNSRRPHRKLLQSLKTTSTYCQSSTKKFEFVSKVAVQLANVQNIIIYTMILQL